MSLKISTSVLAASFAMATVVASVGASAAAVAGNEHPYQSPLARNGIDSARRLYGYAGPSPFADVHYPGPGYTDNHDAWLGDGSW